MDDSIVRVIMGQELVTRRARGYAPLPISLNHLPSQNEIFVAGGAHLKNTVAVSIQNNIFISQHIGDLETNEALKTYENIIHDFQKLYNIESVQAVCDLHPDYLSTKFIKQNYSNDIQVSRFRVRLRYSPPRTGPIPRRSRYPSTSHLRCR